MNSDDFKPCSCFTWNGTNRGCEKCGYSGWVTVLGEAATKYLGKTEKLLKEERAEKKRLEKENKQESIFKYNDTNRER